MRANRNQGIRSLADLQARCEIVGSCWLWTGHRSLGKPQVSLFFDGKKRNLAGRRVALLLAGKSVDGKDVWARRCCPHPDDCIALAHSQSGTRKARGKQIAASGVLKGNPRMKEVGRINAAKRRGAIGPLKAAELREISGMSLSEMARAYGCSKSAVGAIRRGEVYRVHAGGSVFTWRP